MQLNIRKIEERIQKLQEIKRIAADPELVTMLFEFIADEDERMEPLPIVKPDAASAPRLDGAEIVDQMFKGLDPQGSTLLRKRG